MTAKAVMLLVYVLLPLCTGIALYQGRFWLTPPLPGTYTAEALLAVCAALPPLLVSRLRDAQSRAESATLIGFFILWTAAWRPETRALGIALGAACCALVATRRMPSALAGAALMLLAMALAGYERTYGALDSAAVQALLQTHSAEAASFVWQELNAASIALTTMLVLTSWVLAQLASTPQASRRLVRVGIAVLLVALPFAGKDLFDKGRVAAQAYGQLKADLQSTKVPALRFIQRGHRQPMDVVLIVGESTSRRLMQLYGAPLETTPGLNELLPSLIVLTDVVSAHSHTVPSMREMLYRDAMQSGSTVGAIGQTRVSLVEVLRQAGVGVEWISAQAEYGKWAAPISRLAAEADRTLFTNPNGDVALWAGKGANSPDARATAAVVEALKTEPARARLIVQHMFASHWPYCAHRPSTAGPAIEPQGAAWFGDAVDRTEDLACYAAALRFVDEQVATIARSAQARRHPTVVIFTPDHGEDPEGGTGHSASVHVAPHVEVPFVVLFNDAARGLLPRHEAMLRQHAGRPFMNSWTYELVLDLLGVVTDELHFEVPSIASPDYLPKARVLFTRDARVHYDRKTEGDRKDHLEWTRLNLRERIIPQSSMELGSPSTPAPAVRQMPVFAHRVNSVAKALDAKDYFDGIELDVVFEDERAYFAVFHPPAREVGLRLDHILRATADRKALKVWLDFKNADAVNPKSALEQLELLDHRWRLKDRTIIELPSSADASSWRLLAEAGWAVSLYLPYGFADCGVSDDRARIDCSQRSDALLTVARALDASYLSFDISVLPAVLTHMGPDRRGSLELLSWQLRADSADPGLVEYLERLPALSGLIIGFRSRFGR